MNLIFMPMLLWKYVIMSTYVCSNVNNLNPSQNREKQEEAYKIPPIWEWRCKQETVRYRTPVWKLDVLSLNLDLQFISNVTSYLFVKLSESWFPHMQSGDYSLYYFKFF